MLLYKWCTLLVAHSSAPSVRARLTLEQGRVGLVQVCNRTLVGSGGCLTRRRRRHCPRLALALQRGDHGVAAGAALAWGEKSG